MRIRLFIVMLALLSATACAGGGNLNTQTANSAVGNAPAGGAQSASDRAQAVVQMDGGTVTVEYGRPALKGRDLEKLIEPGQEWRMGSNAPTTLATDIDLKFGETVVPKGTYILKAKPVTAGDWLLLVQKDTGQTVAEVPMKLERADSSTELMTIDLAQEGGGGKLALRWGNLILSTGFQKA